MTMRTGIAAVVSSPKSHRRASAQPLRSPAGLQGGVLGAEVAWGSLTGVPMQGLPRTRARCVWRSHTTKPAWTFHVPRHEPLVTRSRWLRSAPPGYSRCSGVCRGHENDLETHPLAGNSLTTLKISPDDRTLPARPRLPVPACWSRLPIHLPIRLPIRLPTRLPGPHLPSPTAPVSPALTDKQCRPQCRPPAVLAD